MRNDVIVSKQFEGNLLKDTISATLQRISGDISNPQAELEDPWVHFFVSWISRRERSETAGQIENSDFTDKPAGAP